MRIDNEVPCTAIDRKAESMFNVKNRGKQELPKYQCKQCSYVTIHYETSKSHKESDINQTTM